MEMQHFIWLVRFMNGYLLDSILQQERKEKVEKIHILVDRHSFADIRGGGGYCGK